MTAKRCVSHGVLEPCPLCAVGAWPLRDLNAVVDFAGKPYVEGGVAPEVKSIRLSQVIRSIGRRWMEIERVKLTALKPLYTTKNALVREARIGAIDIGRLEKAAAAVARGESGSKDPVVDAYMQAIIDDDSPW